MQKDAPKAGDTLATIKTNRGTMVAKLFVEQVPEGVKNFVELAKYQPIMHFLTGLKAVSMPTLSLDGTPLL